MSIILAGLGALAVLFCIIGVLIFILRFRESRITNRFYSAWPIPRPSRAFNRDKLNPPRR